MDISLDLTQVLIAIITLLGGWITKEVSGYFAAKKEKIREQVKNDKVYNYISLAMNTVQDVVLALNQSMVNDLKAAAANGKLTDEQKKEIKDKAVIIVEQSLSGAAQEALNMVYGDLTTVIQTWIDKTVADVKQKNTINAITIPQNITNYTMTTPLNNIDE